MYIQAQNADRPFNIPNNYSGNAFRGGAAQDIGPEEALPIESEPRDQGDLQESAAPQDSAETSQSSSEASLLCQGEDNRQDGRHRESPLRSLFDSLMPPKMSPHRQSNGIFGDIGFEELLIIGLALLMAQNESDDSILIMLLILLLYK